MHQFLIASKRQALRERLEFIGRVRPCKIGACSFHRLHLESAFNADNDGTGDGILQAQEASQKFSIEPKREIWPIN